MRRGVVEEVLPALEALDELLLAPRGQRGDGGVQGLGAELEADLFNLFVCLIVCFLVGV